MHYISSLLGKQQGFQLAALRAKLAIIADVEKGLEVN